MADFGSLTALDTDDSSLTMTINISLAYASSVTDHDYLEMTVPTETTIYQALQIAGWLKKYPEIAQWCEQVLASDTGLATRPNARQWYVGVYSQKKPLDYQLNDHERIEVYRPLTADPMNRRKIKATW